MGLVGFWWLEVSSLLFVYMLFSFFLSGHMFPLDILPEPWKTLVMLTPLPYLAYFPAAVLLGKIEGAELARGLAVQAIWVGWFILLSRAMFHYGTKRYSAYGG
jgi:ABC-2 type transport system permease protein